MLIASPSFDQPAAVAHQLAVGQLVDLAPGLDAARGDAEPAVAPGRRPRVEAGGAANRSPRSFGSASISRTSTSPSIMDTSRVSPRPSRAVRPAGEVPARRAARRRGQQQRLAVPVERQRHQVRRTVSRRAGHPEVDVVGEPVLGVATTLCAGARVGGHLRNRATPQGRRSACTWCDARRPDSIAPSTNPLQPSARSEPANTSPLSGPAWRRDDGVPPRAVDRPGAARELVGQPVVRRRVDDLEPGNEPVERALHRDAIVGVDGRGVATEPDQELAAVRQEPVGHEVAEGMTWRDRVDAARLSPNPQPQLYPRDAWPSAMASRLAAESSSKRMCGRTLSGTVSTHVRACRTSPLRVRTSTPPAPGRSSRRVSRATARTAPAQPSRRSARACRRRTCRRRRSPA